MPIRQDEQVTDGDDLFGGATGARRSGEEVLRPAGPWTPAVHALMRHVAVTGVAETPEVLGLDESGDYERLRWRSDDLMRDSTARSSSATLLWSPTAR